MNMRNEQKTNYRWVICSLLFCDDDQLLRPTSAVVDMG